MDYAKSYDAVVFDVLKVTPEEFAVSTLTICAAYKTDQILPERLKHTIRLLTWQSLKHIKEGVGGWLSDKVPRKRMLVAQRY